MKLNHVLILLIIFQSSFASGQMDYKKIDSIIVNTSYTSKDSKSLSNEIAKDFKSSVEKVRAF